MLLLCSAVCLLAFATAPARTASDQEGASVIMCSHLHKVSSVFQTFSRCSRVPDNVAARDMPLLACSIARHACRRGALASAASSGWDLAFECDADFAMDETAAITCEMPLGGRCACAISDSRGRHLTGQAPVPPPSAPGASSDGLPQSVWGLITAVIVCGSVGLGIWLLLAVSNTQYENMKKRAQLKPVTV